MNRRTFLVTCALWLCATALSGSARADDPPPPPGPGTPRERWEKLSPEQREKLRERYRQFEKLPPEQQKKMRERYQRFRSLPR